MNGGWHGRRKAKPVVVKGKREKKFSASDMISNTAITAVGAGVAAAAATSAVWPVLVATAAGGVIGYTVMNEIPKSKNEVAD